MGNHIRLSRRKERFEKGHQDTHMKEIFIITEPGQGMKEWYMDLKTMQMIYI